MIQTKIRYSFFGICRVLLLQLLLLVSCAVRAEWRVEVTNYAPSTYLAGTQNWQLLQQDNGWLYVANNYGLLEFDGETWRTYGIWNSTALRSLAKGKNGEIYVGGSHDFGVFRCNSLGRLDYTSLADSVPAALRTFGEVWNIVSVGNDLYIQTRNTVFHRNAQGHVSVVVSDMRMYCMALWDDVLYIATSDGLYALRGAMLNMVQGSDVLRGTEIRGMQAIGEEGLLIGTDFNGMFLCDGKEVHPYYTEADRFLHDNQLYSFAVSERYIAFGTVLQGIVLTDRKGKICYRINRNNGLQNNTVLNLLFDNDQNLWAGLDQGISCVRLNRAIRWLHDADVEYGSGYASVLRSGVLYLGTNQGLYSTSCRENGDVIGALQLVEGSLGQVWNLEDIGGTVFCCHNRGLFEVDGNMLYPVCVDEGFWCVRKWDERYLLAGSYSGIWLLEQRGGHWVALRHVHGFEDTALHFETDASGAVWIVSQQGVERLVFNETMDSFSAELICPFNNNHDYFDIAKIDDKLFISSADCCMLVNSGGIVESADEFCRLLEGKQHYPLVHKDAYNNLWYLSGTTLKVRRYNMHQRVYAAEPIVVMKNTNFFIGGFAHLNSIGKQRVILGGVPGYCLIDWHALAAMEKDVSPGLCVRRMRLLGERNDVVYGEAWEHHEENIRLPYGTYSIRFELGSTCCLGEGKEYAMRLLPIEKEFVVTGSVNQRDFTALKDGNYTLQAKVYSPRHNRTGMVNFNFSIAPPWYRTTTAYVLYALLSLGLVSLIVWSVLRWSNHGKKRLEEKKNAEIAAQEAHYSEEMNRQQLTILQLQNEKVEYELRNKSKELSNLLLTQVNRNELIADIQEDMRKVSDCLKNNETQRAADKLRQLQSKLSHSKENEMDWHRFEENFDMVNDNFLKKLSARYPWMSKDERKLCVYIHMGLLTKEIAPLMNLSVRGVEMMRYRLRRKMGLDAQVNLQAAFREITDDNSI